MKNLKDHEQRKRSLLAWYDYLLQNAAVLRLEAGDSTIKPAALREKQEDLKRSRFVVAVCGQMNAGKSTLLNALIFRDEVLPASPTTMTAKIALLSGGESPEVEATFYTADEFRTVLQAAGKDAVSRDELQAAREAAKRAGLNEQEILRHPARVERRAGLRSLSEFVAVPTDGGRYTPYVKSVAVRANEPWLHQVMVADTPGTNDPNPERDKITREWIAQADAVVYVTYAGAAGLDAEDARFLDTHLLHVESSRRIIAVNKFDLQSDERAIRSHFRALCNGGDLRLQALFREERNVVLVSGLGGLIASMVSQGLQLGEEAAEMRPGLEAGGWLNADRHGVDALRALIEERIIATRGEGIITSHHQRIVSVIDGALRRCEREQSNLQEKLKALGTTVEERKQKRDRLQKGIHNLQAAVRHEQARLEKEMNEARGEVGRATENIHRKIVEMIDLKLKQNKYLDQLAKEAVWVVPEAIAAHRGAFGAAFGPVIATIEIALNRAAQMFAEKAPGSGDGPSEFYPHVIAIDTDGIVRQVERDVESGFTRDIVQNTVSDVTGILQKWFNTSGGREKALQSIWPEINKQVRHSTDAIIVQFLSRIGENATRAMSVMAEGVQEDMRARQSMLESMATEATEVQREHRETVSAMNELSERQAQIQSLLDRFKREHESEVSP